MMCCLAAAIYNQVWSTNLIFFVSCILILLLTTAAASLGYYLVMRPLRGYGNGAAAHGCIGLYGKNALQ